MLENQPAVVHIWRMFCSVLWKGNISEFCHDVGIPPVCERQWGVHTVYKHVPRNHETQFHELSECDQSPAMSKSVAPLVDRHTTCIFKVTENSVMKIHMNNTAYGLFRFW